MEKEKAKRSKEIIIKVKKVISTIISVLGIMACGGVVFAAVSGMIKIGNRGIIFTDKYNEYEQKVENQYLEKEEITCENKNEIAGKDTENTDNAHIVLYNGHKIDKGIGTYDWGDEDYKIDNTKIYYNYNKGKYIGETTGINLDNILPIISTSKKYEAIPRKYEKIHTIPEKLNFLRKDDVINVEINKIDLDGDRKEEYICCYAIEYKTGDYSEMYEYELLRSHIEILDSDYNKIGSLIHLESDSDVYLSLEEDVEYFDIDNDGIMEILINIPGWWKWSGLEIYKYNNSQISGNIDSYNYASYRHGS